jgi:uncharacterized protein YbbC (DUF1343 family)
MRLAIGPQSLPTLLALVGAIGCGPPPDGSAALAVQSTVSAPVRAGIEVLLEDSLHLVAGLRVGVVTNHTGLSAGPDEEPLHTIDRLHEHPEVDLVAIFGPEHGYRGEAEAGVHVESGQDQATGLPVHSLYGSAARRKPTPEMLEGVDVLVFDMQDVGARYYTYVSTMALAMEAAGEVGIPFVVLDRPNPIDGVTVQGNVLDPAFATFVGMYPVPMRHGMTPGELARLFVGEFGVGADLHVVPAEGWLRDMQFEETGLPWVAPSPNMPDVVSALHYPGTCLFEGTSLSVGRGTERPFQQVGAPWIDGAALSERLNARGIPGVRFDAVRFTPEAPGDGKFRGTPVQGVRFVATDRTYDPTRAAMAALEEARRMSGDDWAWREAHFDRLAGTDHTRLDLIAGRPADEVVEGWVEQIEAFRELRAPYLIYPETSRR